MYLLTFTGCIVHIQRLISVHIHDPNLFIQHGAIFIQQFLRTSFAHRKVPAPSGSQRALPRTVSLLLLVEHFKKAIKREKPSIPPCMTKTHAARLWCPSICHKLFGPATEYALLEITTAQRILEFPGSTLAILSLIRSRWTLRANDRRCRDSKEYPTKVPWSHMKHSTRFSTYASETTEKPVISSSPYSTIRRLNVHRKTRNIWPILGHVKSDDLRCWRTSSDNK